MEGGGVWVKVGEEVHGGGGVWVKVGEEVHGERGFG